MIAGRCGRASLSTQPLAGHVHMVVVLYKPVRNARVSRGPPVRANQGRARAQTFVRVAVIKDQFVRSFDISNGEMGRVPASREFGAS